MSGSYMSDKKGMRPKPKSKDSKKKTSKKKK